MPLWGNIDYASGNQKPVFANTSNAYSNSTINGVSANTVGRYGNMYGVSAQESQNVRSDQGVTAGWVSQKIGTGPIATITINNPGAGYNANGFLIITNNSSIAGAVSGGANANIAFFVSANANSQLNVITSVVINNPGDSFALPPTLTANGSNLVAASFTLTLGGRAGRRQYETIVAMGSITGDDGAKDNVFFVGV